MRLTLVRHGETESNVRGSLDTTAPGPGLTERGQQQAEALVQRFADQDFDAIYASNLTRTQLTAAPVAAAKNLPVHIRQGLREFDIGHFENRSDPAAIGVFVDVMKQWMLGEFDASLPGGETGWQILRRMDETISGIAGTGDQSVLVFSHGGVLRVWAAARSDNISPDFAVANYVVNTGVIVLEGHPGAWHCQSWDLAPRRA